MLQRAIGASGVLLTLRLLSVLEIVSHTLVQGIPKKRAMLAYNDDSAR